LSYLHELHRDFATRSHQSRRTGVLFTWCVYMCICTLKHGQLPYSALSEDVYLGEKFCNSPSQRREHGISLKRGNTRSRCFLLLRPAHQHQLSRLINYCLMPEQASHHFNRIRSGRGAWSDNCCTEHRAPRVYRHPITRLPSSVTCTLSN
jgi:hypothetical protein